MKGKYLKIFHLWESVKGLMNSETSVLTLGSVGRILFERGVSRSVMEFSCIGTQYLEMEFVRKVTRAPAVRGAHV